MANTASAPRAAELTRSRIIGVVAAIAILALIVLVGLAVLIMWLVLAPNHLRYSIESSSIQNFNLDNDHLSATLGFLIRAENPSHKISIYYDSIHVVVAFDGETLAFSNLEPFHQPRRNVSHLQATLEAREVLLPRDASNELRNPKASGEVELKVRVTARIRFKLGTWRLRRRVMKIKCNPVLVHFSSFKSYGSTDCDLHY